MNRIYLSTEARSRATSRWIGGISSSRAIRRKVPVLLGTLAAIAAALVTTPSLSAQGLNWEGQTGAFITPFAYTSASPSKGMGRPQLSFHYLDGGSVIGGLAQSSVTVGFLKRFEMGVTRTSTLGGSTPGLSPLFEGGFNTFHGKINFLPENTGGQFMPALSVGFVTRRQVRHVGGVLNGSDTHNGDYCIVATKTITQIKGLPILLSGGYKQTNASVFGIAGNATAWQGRCFGTGAIVLSGPGGSAIIAGAEFAQQPHYIQGLPGATVPTSFAYFFRIIPAPERLNLNIDLGLAQAAGEIAPGLDLLARNQFALGISYQF
jgi:hypothetical protein